MLDSWTSSPKLRDYVLQNVKLCQPDRVHLLDGSPEEQHHLSEELVASGTFTRLNPELRPNSYLARSDPGDTARVESKTFICSETKDSAGPTNNWVHPKEMKKKLNGLFNGCMKGRTMYVVPFCMGPIDSPLAKIGVEITDSAYVAVNMSTMTRMGPSVMDLIGRKGDFVPCLHSVGQPLAPGQTSARWPCNNAQTTIAHFPDSREIIAFGSGYGGNALLGKKSLALRIASVMARDEGWLAEHMNILALINEKTGERTYMAGAFPSACGKTNLAMLESPLPGWRVEVIGDDICWMRLGDDGRLYAVNPEKGFFGVAPGTSTATNANAMKCIERDTIFTNVAMTPKGDVWWEGIDGKKSPPPGTITWLGKKWQPGQEGVAAHKNSRFTAKIEHCPCLDPAWNDPKGVPISAILFGGRRSDVVPLVFEAPTWERGVLAGAMTSSEYTIASEKKGLQHDPFAMSPFCGYHMAEYFAHWLTMPSRTGNRGASKLPKIFGLNWFRKGQDGQFLWPGYGDNLRVLKWINDRVHGVQNCQSTPIGNVPIMESLDLENLSVPQSSVAKALRVDHNQWKAEVAETQKFFSEKLQGRVPSKLIDQLDKMRKGLDR